MDTDQTVWRTTSVGTSRQSRAPVGQPDARDRVRREQARIAGRADFVRSLTLLRGRVHSFAQAMSDEWLVVTAYVMVEDLFKSCFNQFRWIPGVPAYVAATAGEVVKELTQRGFVLHYVIDNTVSNANLAEVLDYMPQLFETARLSDDRTQLMAGVLMAQDGLPQEISRIPEYRDRGTPPLTSW